MSRWSFSQSECASCFWSCYTVFSSKVLFWWYFMYIYSLSSKKLTFLLFYIRLPCSSPTETKVCQSCNSSSLFCTVIMSPALLLSRRLLVRNKFTCNTVIFTMSPPIYNVWKIVRKNPSKVVCKTYLYTKLYTLNILLLYIIIKFLYLLDIFTTKTMHKHVRHFHLLYHDICIIMSRSR